MRAAAELTLPPQLPLQSSGVRSREGRAGCVWVTRRGHHCLPLRMEANWGTRTSVSEPQAGGGLQRRGLGLDVTGLANLGASGADVAPLEPQGGGVAVRGTCSLLRTMQALQGLPRSTAARAGSPRLPMALYRRSAPHVPTGRRPPLFLVEPRGSLRDNKPTNRVQPCPQCPPGVTQLGLRMGRGGQAR